MAWYKLVGYDYSQWDYNYKEYPKNHIEDIVTATEGASWVATTNYQLDPNSMLSVQAKGTFDQLPFYLKYVDTTDRTWYYRRTAIQSAKNLNKSGELEYYAVWELDKYQTIFNKKLAVLHTKNTRVYAKTGWQKRFYNINVTSHKAGLDIINKQPYLGKTVNLIDAEKIHNLAFASTRGMLRTLNYSDTTFPESETWNVRTAETYSITVSNVHNYFEIPTSSNTGRYCYIVCKSSANQTISSNTTKPYKTSQTYFIIPLFNNEDTTVTTNVKFCGTADSILHALNDFDTTIDNNNGMLNIGSDNFIGYYECDIPFDLFWGLEKNNSNVKPWISVNFLKSGTTTESHCIFYWELPITEPLCWNLMSSTQLTSTSQLTEKSLMYKLNYMWNHRNWRRPDTEPWLLNPMFFSESYRNGNSDMNVDLSQVIPTFTGGTIDAGGGSLDDLTLKSYFNFGNTLTAGYNFGTSTNTYNGTYDNTFVKEAEVSIPNLLYGSTAANYVANNANTLSTSMNVLKQQQQIQRDENIFSNLSGGLNTAKKLGDMFSDVGEGHYGSALGNGLGSILNVAKLGFNRWKMQKQQEMQWQQFRSNVNNLKSSPNVSLGDKYVKSNIPYWTTETITTLYWRFFSDEISEHCRMIYFNWLLNNGYILDDWYNMQEIDNVCTYMNIINISGAKSGNLIHNVLDKYDTGKFNTQEWDDEFIAWLDQPNKIYTNNTWVNCTNWTSKYTTVATSDYVDNIERDGI